MDINGMWRATGLRSDGGMNPILSGSAITMEIVGANVSGHSGVNRYSGGLVGGVLGPMASTMMAGSPDLMEQERCYLDFLTGSVPVRTGDTSLELTLEGEVVVAMELVPRVLVGVPWVMTGHHNGKGGYVSAVAGSEVTAEFDDEGHMFGSGGCNRYRASFEMEGNSISISPPMSTRMACPDEKITEQETMYFALLETVSSFRFADQRGMTSLEMFDGADQRILGFVVGELARDKVVGVHGTVEDDQNV
jgi:heat shock protein HslJ